MVSWNGKEWTAVAFHQFRGYMNLIDACLWVQKVTGKKAVVLTSGTITIERKVS